MKGMGHKLFVVFIFIISFCTLTLTAWASGEAQGASFVSYDAREFLMSVDHEDGSIVVCVKKEIPILRLKWSEIYRVADGKSRLLLSTGTSITSIFAYAGHVFYVSAGNGFSWRGKLMTVPALENGKTELLDESHGCGEILGVSNNCLFVETDKRIVSISLADYKTSLWAAKQLYLTASTEEGITYYDGRRWKFCTWESPSLSETIGVPLEREGEDLRVFACSPDCFVRFDRKNASAFFVNDQDSMRVDQVLSVCANNECVYLLVEQNKSNGVHMVDLSSKPLSVFPCNISIPCRSSIYAENGMLYYIDDYDRLHSVSLPNQ